ncbi:MAG: hypothetical protein IPL32_18040 [Chloracidobacterium sp.]|nr:hypothetical protein [Chloracidobacterium sp.]
MKDTKERKKKAESVTGKKAIPVRVQLDILRENGILIDLTITGSGMFTKTASFDEIGFLQDNGKDARYGWIKPGAKFLIPEDAVKRIKSVVTRMRQVFEAHSRKVAGFSPYNWMPYTAHPAFVEKWKELREEFYETKADIIEHRDEYVDTISTEYERIALSAWKAMAAQDGGKVFIGKEEMDMEDFVSYMIEKAISLVPSVEAIEEKLHADYITALVYSELDVEKESAEVAKVRRELEAASEKSDLENRILLEELRTKTIRNNAEKEERDVKIEAMRQAELEHAREQIKETVSPFVEVYKNALSECVDRAADLLDTIRKGGVVRGKIAEKGRGLLEFYNMMLIPELTDERMVDRLTELQKLLGESGSKDESRDVSAITAKLKEIVELQDTVADEIEGGGGKFSAIEI